jgi:uncharacterized protein HemX
MDIIILVVVILSAGINIFLQISNSLLLIKTFEQLKQIQEDKELDKEAQQRAKGLVDLVTEQTVYPLRLR